ncbi:MAG: Tic22 family protein [Crocosphaera sp.]
MKSLIRWGVTVGLLSSTVLTSWLGQIPKALALPQEDVIKVLQPVIVFGITTEEGDPLVATPQENQNVTPVFISQQDAKKYLDGLKANQPDIGNQFKVQPLPLGEMYRFALANSTDTQSFNLVYIPMQSAVESAKQVLNGNGQEYQGGVPLFTFQGATENSFAIMQQNNQKMIPFFFEKADIQRIADQMKKEQPENAATIKIQVIPLESVIGLLQAKDDEMLKQIQLIPSQETIKFIQEAIKSQQNQGQ